MQEVRMCECAGGEAVEEEELRAGLDRIIADHRGQPGALIQVLHKAQELLGYLPIEAQERVASGLGVPLSEVYGVVSFYSYFRMVPRGQHTIRVCLGTACYVRGGRKVLAQVQNKLGIAVGGTTDDRNFSLEVVRCIGACGLAPVLAVGGDIYRRVKPSKVSDLLGKYRGSGSGRDPSGRAGG
jgi:NADH:ubiquinone oxidoreductase subunit E